MLTLKELQDILSELQIEVNTPMNEQERLKDAVINDTKDDDSVLENGNKQKDDFLQRRPYERRIPYPICTN